MERKSTAKSSYSNLWTIASKEGGNFAHNCSSENLLYTRRAIERAHSGCKRAPSSLPPVEMIKSPSFCAQLSAFFVHASWRCSLHYSGWFDHGRGAPLFDEQVKLEIMKRAHASAGTSHGHFFILVINLVRMWREGRRERRPAGLLFRPHLRCKWWFDILETLLLWLDLRGNVCVVVHDVHTWGSPPASKQAAFLIRKDERNLVRPQIPCPSNDRFSKRSPSPAALLVYSWPLLT